MPPATTILERARDLYARGDLASAHALLAERADPLDSRASFLAAEILIRSGAPERARAGLLRQLSGHEEKNAVSAHLLLARACLACEDRDGAVRALDVVRARHCIPSEREEEALYRARIARTADDSKAFRDALKIACGSADPVLNARAHRLAGDDLLERGRFVEAFAEYGRGFAALDSQRPLDDRLLATLLVDVAFAEAEFAHAEPEATLTALGSRPWNPSLAPIVSAALCHAGLYLSRRSRYAEAAAAFVRSSLLGGESPGAVAALARAQQSALAAGEPYSAQGFAVAALALAERLDWERQNADGAEALVPLALMLARSGDLAGARRFAARFEAAARSGAGAQKRAALRSIFSAHLSAVIAAGTPASRDDGVRRLRAVRQDLSRAGFAWRAIEVRADLFAVTGQTFLLEANRAQRRELLRAARSEVPEVAPGSGLSPQQHRIVAAVARGNATVEIALELGISGRTVKNQLHKIYHKLDIENPSREKLVAFVHANPKLFN